MFTSIILFYIVSTTIFLFTSSSEAVCINKAVYDSCRNIGDTKLASCPPTGYTCQCDARKQIQLCFQQCRDDLDIQNEGKAYEPAVQQFCGLAASAATTSFVPTGNSTSSSSGSNIPTTIITTKTTSNANKLSLSKPIVMFLIFLLVGYIVMV
ncbi:15062_t:CDS:2 [Entrophospora sp. SA101]|nr:15062_t:CDS:2 [Entrophospora sp. SA101]